MKKKNKTLVIIFSVLILAFFVVEIGTIAYRSYQQQQAQQKQSQAAQSSSQPKLNEKYSHSQLDRLQLPQLTSDLSKGESKVTIETTEGTITAKIFNKYAPLAAQNFLTHAKEGYYNNTEFFRVVKDFMIQGGDPENSGQGGQSIWASDAHRDKKIDPGTGFKNEIDPHLYFIRGAIGMANAGPGTNGSQFFIEQSSSDVREQISNKSSYPTKIYQAYKNGGTPSLDGNYTVFGQVISGMDIVDKIASAAVKNNPNAENEKSLPEAPVKVTKITVQNN